jgi:hypothetical protein
MGGQVTRRIGEYDFFHFLPNDSWGQGAGRYEAFFRVSFRDSELGGKQNEFVSFLTAKFSCSAADVPRAMRFGILAGIDSLHLAFKPERRDCSRSEDTAFRISPKVP